MGVSSEEQDALKRGDDEEDGLDEQARQMARRMAGDLTTLYDTDGTPVGRICVLDHISLSDKYRSSSSIGIVTAGPARTATRIFCVAGLLMGRPSRAARDQAVPIVQAEEMSSWAAAEASRLTSLIVSGDVVAGEWCAQVAEELRQLGGNADSLPCWMTRDGWLDYAALREWIHNRTEIIVAHPVYAYVREGMDDIPIDLMDDVLVHEWSQRSPLSLRNEHWPTGNNGSRGNSEWIIRAIAESWNISEFAVRAGTRRRESDRSVGKYNSKEIVGNCQVLVREDLARFSQK
jgi:hypothetical protein